MICACTGLNVLEGLQVIERHGYWCEIFVQNIVVDDDNNGSSIWRRWLCICKLCV